MYYGTPRSIETLTWITISHLLITWIWCMYSKLTHPIACIGVCHCMSIRRKVCWVKSNVATYQSLNIQQMSLFFVFTCKIIRISHSNPHEHSHYTNIQNICKIQGKKCLVHSTNKKINRTRISFSYKFWNWKFLCDDCLMITRLDCFFIIFLAWKKFIKNSNECSSKIISPIMIMCWKRYVKRGN